MHDLKFYATLFLIAFSTLSIAQTVEDNFEGNGTITTWFGDDCGIDTQFSNPFQEGINTSSTVLEYRDQGGTFANVRFEVDNAFDLSENHTFSLKIYIPSSGLTGNQPNQVSLKLQNGTLGEPWATQSEIIKPLQLNQWQTVTFDFQNDNYINLDGNSPPPTQRDDFTRVVIQINGENNNDHVLAYIDDVAYDGTIIVDPVFDNLVWSDEFEGSGMIDTDKWFHQTQLPAGDTWFNGEIQHYTDRIENTFLENGAMHLTAIRENFTDQGVTKNFTSARLNSKFAFQYGRVEVRARMPFGPGTWPAIWLLGKNINEDGAYWDNLGFDTTPWPACGELDIMEHWGTNQNYVSSAIHSPSSFGATVNVGGQIIETVSDAFHVYEMVWTPEKVEFSVDGNVHYIYNPEDKNAATWPFDQEMYLILNVAMLPSVAPNFSSSAMEVDYVRVYQETPVSTIQPSATTTLDVFPNPFKEELQIKTGTMLTEAVDCHIYNANGQYLQTINGMADGELITLRNLSGLPSGVYYVTFFADKKQYTIQAVKQ
jgi:beta-glucanase (GH16 family)